MLRKLLLILGVLVILVVVAAFVAPMLIPKDWLREQITAQAKEATGRDLVIGGDLSLQLLPSAVVNLSDVRFANNEGGSRPDMATLKELRVHVAVLPLLSSQVEIREFVLVEPDILLEVDKDGRANWAFGGGGDTAATGSGSGSGGTGGGAGLDSLKLGDVRLVNGRVEYRDAASGTAEVIESLNVSISMPDLDSPLAVNGALTWHGEAMEMNLTAAKPRALSEGDASPVSLALTGTPLTFDFEGTIDAGAQTAIGKLTLNVPSVLSVAEWTGNPLDVKGDVLGPLNVAGDLSASPTNVTFNGMTLAIDDIEGTGGLSAALGTAVPSIKADLALEDLNLNPYLEAFGGGGDNAAGMPAAQPAKSQGWSDEPIDVSALRMVNADLSLTTKLLQVQEIKVDESALAVKLSGGKLAVDLSKLVLYGGNGSGKVNVDASGKVPAIASSFKLSGLQARPFLTDAAGSDLVSGTAQMDLDITANGQSQKAMVSALNGKGGFKFEDGAVYGINIAAMIRDPASFIMNKDAASQKTDFAELSGTYDIKNGLLTNNNLKLQSPLLRIAGAGTVNMPPRTLDYKIEPKAVASIQGQGGASDHSGILVPVLITGSWDNPQIKPDLAGAAGQIAKDPSQLLKGGDPTKSLKSLVPGAGGTDGDSGSGSSGSSGATDGIKKLLGR
jgi:AsmA protein